MLKPLVEEEEGIGFSGGIGVSTRYNSLVWRRSSKEKEP